jgi:hypothetical protein
MKTISRTLAAMLLSLAPALSQADDTLPPVIEACASLRRDPERLACFDKAVAALKSGGQLDQVSAENMFGANSGNTQAASSADDIQRDEIKKISGTVTSLRRTDDGMIVLELDNGQIWRQQDSDVRMLVAAGDVVTIVRASMGTFRIGDKTGRFARFKRVR